MTEFINGMNVALCIVAGLIFLKFWTGTRDRLFLWFSIAFWILAANRGILAILPYFTPRASEHAALIYSVRLLAFILILVAIIDKNRRSSQNTIGHDRQTG
jgi:hypothetical protein